MGYTGFWGPWKYFQICDMKHIAVSLILTFLFIAGASAQAIKIPREVKALGDAQSVDSLNLFEILSDNAPGSYPVAGVPYFTVVAKGGMLVFGAGGFVKAVAGWDIGHPMLNIDEFLTSCIPMEAPDGDGARFGFSARQTALYVNLVALPGNVNQVGAFLGMNFLEDNYTPVLQYAYFKWRGIKAGYDDTLFSDPACGPPAVDYEGPPSNTASPVAGISYTWNTWHWGAGMALEYPNASFTTVEGMTRMVHQRVPDIPIMGRYSWHDGNSWVRFSAIFRNLMYRNEVARTNHNRFGYGFQLSGALNFLDNFTFFYQGVWGKGIGSMLQDTADEGLDLTPCCNGEGLHPVMLWGGFVSLQYDISSRWAASATYSQMRFYANKYLGGTTEWDNLYKYSQYVSANVFFEATPYIEIGLENIWGRRVNYDGMHAADNRIQASIQMTF